MTLDAPGRRGPPRTGCVEPLRRADGTLYFRARIRVADGTRVRVDVPEKYCTPAGGKTARERAELYAEALQEREDETGELMAQRGARPRAPKSGAGETASEWFERYVEVHGRLGNGTAQHAGDWRRNVPEACRAKPLTAWTPDDVKAIRDGLTRLRLDGKLTAKRCMNVWSTVVKAPLSRAFTDDDPKYSSVRVGPAKANPAMAIKPPVSKADEDEDARDRQALEPGEGAALLACSEIAVETRRFYAWAMLTGLRPAELYGLTWDDVREGVIKVQRGRNMKSGEDGDTKTRQGVRDVPIHPHLEALIRSMRGAGRVFPVQRVRHVEQHAAELRAHLVVAGVTRRELHEGTKTLRAFDVRAFRTTFATWCARSGFDSAWIDAWLGHAPKSTAAKHYVKDTGALAAGVFPVLPAGLTGPSAGPSDPQVPETIVRRKGLEPLQELPHWNLNRSARARARRAPAPRATSADAASREAPTKAED